MTTTTDEIWTFAVTQTFVTGTLEGITITEIIERHLSDKPRKGRVVKALMCSVSYRIDRVLPLHPGLSTQEDKDAFRI